jgi:Ca2+/Na+ antiporter
MLAVFFCGIFMIKYRIELLIAIPFLCGLFCLYLIISFKHNSSAQKPEKLFKEKWLMIYMMFFLVLLTVLLFVSIPALHFFLDFSLIRL